MTSASPRTKLFADALGVFQGGGCRAAAYAGAFRAARERGTHFAAVAGASAGAIVAVLIAGGAEPDWLDRQLLDLDFRGLLTPPAASPPLARLAPGRLRQALQLASGTGLHSTRQLGRWVEARLQELLPDHARPVTLFRDLPMTASIIAADLATGRPRVWGTNSTPAESVATAVRASCAIPFFFEPEAGTLVDGGVLSNLPTYLIDRDAGDRLPVLAFSLVDDASAHVSFSNAAEIATALANTVVSGAQEIQLQLQPRVQVIEIDTGSVRATDFAKMTRETTEALRAAGYDAVRKFFDGEGINARPPEEVHRYTRSTERWDAVADELIKAQREVLVSSSDSGWVYELFSALLIARLNGVRVTVVLPDATHDRHEEYRRALLRALGCSVMQLGPSEEIRLECFGFDTGLDRSALIAMSGSGVYDSAIYRGRDGDERLIRLISSNVFPEQNAPVGSLRGLTPADDDEVFAVLRQVDQYRTASIKMTDVELDAVDSWARYALAYKQRQQQEMARVIRGYGIAPFAPFWVNFEVEGTRSLAMPPIVELGHDGRYTVVNGLSRLLLLRREGRAQARCAVVADVGAPPPATGVLKLSQVGVKIGVRGDPSHRYPGFHHGGVRNVEGPAHTLESLDPRA